MEPLFTPEQLAEIHAFHQPYYIRAAVGPFANLALMLLMLGVLVQPLHRLAVAAAAGLERRLGFLRAAPVSRAFFRAMDRLWGEPGWGAAVLFALFTDLFVSLVYLPVDVWFSYTLEHRHGMSTQTPATFAYDMVKAQLLAAFAISALVIGMFGLARKLRQWWLVLGVPVALLLLVSGALDPYRSRLFFNQKPLPEGPLRTRIVDLMEQADIAFADVLVEETSVASRRLQAYFAGQGPTRTIVLNDIILKELSEDEVLAAVAHEAGHVNESKWPARIASSLMLVALLFALDRLLRLSASRGWFGATHFADIRNLPLISLLFFLLVLTAKPLSGAFSREREREADRYALRLTGDVDAFRRMLVKAARVNKMDPEPPRWVVLKGMSHPPIGERIASLPTP
ncbi:M48 family metalloprotease [Myxococcus xanthus]|uniref:Peptidase M48 n=1 Tax=Myxococcus xanthus TaxID=34 RepID=A0AAE6KUR5_MYXXA|nr:M48 family metalloprotease [Myxococcus xanthus]QDE70703.1 peptidase M48 [Myxococcus xanthus]QDE77982.1 peptidase M48 [Myxococcus xanthus]QDE85364.1 peptidase M48 [Myxococcus xanthus]QDE99526.1 peptidase M48 [Myxococcus xanthus]QDF07243.1 peptidase M48 [Myxococcus xanthus]